MPVRRFAPRTARELRVALRVFACASGRARSDARFGPIEHWDLRQLRSLRGAAAGLRGFDADLSAWDVSRITDARRAFAGCRAFRGRGLAEWDVSSIRVADSMFEGCRALDEPLWCWQPLELRSARRMFHGAARTTFPWRSLACWPLPALRFSRHMIGRRDADPPARARLRGLWSQLGVFVVT